jgi:predicted NBD/HSP70 family sugar kinase
VSILRLEDEGTPAARIESLLRARGPMTRAELARSAGLHKSTVTAAAGELCASGRVVEGEKVHRQPGGRGRRGTLLSLPPASAVGVGIDFGFRRIRAVALDAAHREIGSESIAISDRLGGPEATAAAEALGRRMLTRSRSDACAGAVAISIGQCLINPAELRDRLGVPAVVDNDARCAARAELVRGAGRPYSDFLFFRLHSGVRGAVVLGGEVRAGSNGDGAVLASLQPLFPAPDTLADLLVLLAAGHPGSRCAVIEAAHAVGRVAAELCDAFGPQAVILGGALTVAGDLLTEEVTRSLRAACLPVGSDVAVLTGALGPRASVLGAATLALTAAI